MLTINGCSTEPKIQTEYITKTEYVEIPAEYLKTFPLPVIKGQLTDNLRIQLEQTQNELDKSNMNMESLIEYNNKIKEKNQ